MSKPSVSCEGCGACCLHMSTPPFVDAEDLARVPKPLLDSVYRYLDERDKAGISDHHPCIWLDVETRRCRHHECRPNVCRDFDIGEEDCLAARKRVLLTIEGESQ